MKTLIYLAMLVFIAFAGYLLGYDNGYNQEICVTYQESALDTGDCISYMHAHVKRGETEGTVGINIMYEITVE